MNFCTSIYLTVIVLFQFYVSATRAGIYDSTLSLNGTENNCENFGDHLRGAASTEADFLTSDLKYNWLILEKVNDTIHNTRGTNTTQSYRNIQTYKKIYTSCVKAHREDKNIDKFFDNFRAVMNAEWDKENATEDDIKKMINLLYGLNVHDIGLSNFLYASLNQGENSLKNELIFVTLDGVSNISVYEELLVCLEKNESVKREIINALTDLNSLNSVRTKKVNMTVLEFKKTFPYISADSIKKQLESSNIDYLDGNFTVEVIDNDTIANIATKYEGYIKNKRGVLYNTLLLMLYKVMLPSANLKCRGNTFTTLYEKSEASTTCLIYVIDMNSFWKNYLYDEYVKPEESKVNQFFSERTELFNSITDTEEEWHASNISAPYVRSVSFDRYLNESLRYLTAANFSDDFFANYLLIESFRSDRSSFQGSSSQKIILEMRQHMGLLINPYTRNNTTLRDLVWAIGFSYEIIKLVEMPYYAYETITIFDVDLYHLTMFHKALYLNYQIMKSKFQNKNNSHEYRKYLQEYINLTYKVFSEIGGQMYMGNTIFGKTYNRTRESSLKIVVESFSTKEAYGCNFNNSNFQFVY